MTTFLRYQIILINAALQFDWPLSNSEASPRIWTCVTRPSFSHVRGGSGHETSLPPLPPPSSSSPSVFIFLPLQVGTCTQTNQSDLGTQQSHYGTMGSVPSKGTSSFTGSINSSLGTSLSHHRGGYSANVTPHDRREHNLNGVLLEDGSSDDS